MQLLLMINPPQLIIIPYVPVIFEESEELSKTERSNSGFGSTGQF